MIRRLPVRDLPWKEYCLPQASHPLHYKLTPSFRWNSSSKPASPIRRADPPLSPANLNQAVAGANKTRFERVLNRCPKFLRKWLQPIQNKPLSHITAFLILHEITAVVPLIGLTYLFHKVQWTPPMLPGEWIVEGTEKGAKLIQRYGIQVTGDQFVRLALEFAAAYATVKVLMPARIVVSVWLTPWFARWTIVPFTRLFRRKKMGTGAPPSADTTPGSDKSKDVIL